MSKDKLKISVIYGLICIILIISIIYLQNM